MTTDTLPLSRRVLTMEESQTIAMAQKARQLKSQGIEVISLNLGEPDFPTPAHIQAAAKQAVDDGYFFYTPVPGLPELREAIAEKFRIQNGLHWQAKNIVVSNGAKQSIANVLLSLVDPGDEVVIFAPYWVSYAGIVELAEGKCVFVESGIENDYKPTPEQVRAAITPRTKALIFSSPCNPTGAVFSADELADIAAILEAHPQVFAIADEIYEHINFSATPPKSLGSFEAIRERVITVNGVSKGFAMTGWRIGYIGAPDWLADACNKIQGQVTSGASAVSQRAALAAISGTLAPTQEMTKAYLRRRDLVKSLLDQIEGVKTNLPQGAFYIFPDVSAFFGRSYQGQVIKDSTDLCLYLLNEGHVSLVMGDAFGAPNCLRISYAAADQTIREGISRMKTALEKLS
ncbi:MAG: pyridoxal phosphate-dependent aminotransferase [Bernardetiaceae bacterium]